MIFRWLMQRAQRHAHATIEADELVRDALARLERLEERWRMHDSERIDVRHLRRDDDTTGQIVGPRQAT
jgi:hypothetical protein